MNQPLSSIAIPDPVPPARTRAETNSDGLFVMLFFSGGGTRAAALAYGVLEELARTQIFWEGRTRRLLDEVDLISAVSGGCFPAAYYALYGDRIFSEFESQFLKHNVQGGLTWHLANPVQWFRLGSRHFGWNDLAAEYYDKLLFQGATLGGLASPFGKPILIINATDLATGVWFPFLQSQFDLICSDLGPFPVSRAVAASSAVPGVLNAITLKNYAGLCGAGGPAWARALAEQGSVPERLRARFDELQSYADAPRRPYVHLVDGGLSDNLGVRGVVETLEFNWQQLRSQEWFKISAVRKAVAIIVNARTEKHGAWKRKGTTPGAFPSMTAMIRIFMSRNSQESRLQLYEAIQTWSREHAFQAPVSDTGGLDFYPIEIKFEDLADADERRLCNEMPSTFRLSGEDVDLLRRSASVLLRQSLNFQRLVLDLKAPVE